MFKLIMSKTSSLEDESRPAAPPADEKSEKKPRRALLGFRDRKEDSSAGK